MLLVQPCNLALRATGHRSSKYNHAFLVPIKEYKKDDLNHTKQEILSPTNNSEKFPCVNFPEFKILSLDYLDLTIFNEEGKSFIDMTKSELINDVIHLPWKKRYQNIQKSLIALEKEISSFIYLEKLIHTQINELETKLRTLTKDINTLTKEQREQTIKEMRPIKNEKRDLENHLKTIGDSIYSIENFDNFNLNKVENYNAESHIFSFDIKRVKHYKSPYSDDLLQKFMLYLSRNAFEHDFTS